MILSSRPFFLHQLNVSKLVDVLRQQQGSNTGQRQKPRDSWTSEMNRSLEYSYFKAQLEMLAKIPTTIGKQHYLHKKCADYAYS